MYWEYAEFVMFLLSIGEFVYLCKETLRENTDRMKPGVYRE